MHIPLVQSDFSFCMIRITAELKGYVFDIILTEIHEGFRSKYWCVITNNFINTSPQTLFGYKPFYSTPNPVTWTLKYKISFSFKKNFNWFIISFHICCSAVFNNVMNYIFKEHCYHYVRNYTLPWEELKKLCSASTPWSVLWLARSKKYLQFLYCPDIKERVHAFLPSVRK